VRMLGKIVQHTDLPIRLFSSHTTRRFMELNTKWFPPERFILAPYLPADQLFRLYERSRFVLNCNPTYDGGVHDRIKNAAMAGCCVLTDESRTLLQEFRHRSSLLFISPFVSEDGPQDWNHERFEAIAMEGKAVVEKRYGEAQFHHALRAMLLADIDNSP